MTFHQTHLLLYKNLHTSAREKKKIGTHITLQCNDIHSNPQNLYNHHSNPYNLVQLDHHVLQTHAF